jgi:hypothetical protein
MTIAADDTRERFEERLFSELRVVHQERFGPTRPPTDRARRRGSRALVAAVVLIVVAVALSLALTIGSGPSHVYLDAKTVAYRSQVAIKFAADDFYETHSVTTSRNGTVLESNREWHDGTSDRIETYKGDSPIQEIWHSRTNAGTTIINVYFSRREYFEKDNISTGGPGPSGSGPGPYAPINRLIASGVFREAGPQKVNGVEAIGLQRSVKGDTLKIWVAETTYLPVRWINAQPNGQTNTTDLTWSRNPTATERSALSRPTIPSEYTRVQHLINP